MKSGLRRAFVGAASVGIGVMIAGCVPPEITGSLIPDEVLSSATPPPAVTTRHAEAEPNDHMPAAEALPSSSRLQISGSIAASAITMDTDIYDLGAAAAGDRLTVDVSVINGGDVVFAVIDPQERLLAYVDPASPTAGPRRVDLVVREPVSHLYLLATTRSLSSVARSYNVILDLQPGAGLPPFAPQTVVLEFRGASNVVIGNRPAVKVPVFDAANIDSRFAGQTDAMIARILEGVRNDYRGLGIAIHLASDADIPAGERSTIYFGTYDQRLLGLADNIDPFNADRTQAAILYTDTFSLFRTLAPDMDAMAVALANVTSHEIGHLVGLRHTADPVDIMDVTASARQMMLDQSFDDTFLDVSVMPLGFQDAPRMLGWTLGGTLSTPSAKLKATTRRRALSVVGTGGDFYIPRDMLMDCGGHPDTEQP